MSGDLLRRAASLMRERAEAAKTESVDQGLNWWGAEGITKAFYALGEAKNYGITGIAEDAEHIASWHPAVAVAVADWLDDQGREYAVNEGIWRVSSQDPENRWAERGLTVEANLQHHHKHALAVARAYLGESS